MEFQFLKCQLLKQTDSHDAIHGRLVHDQPNERVLPVAFSYSKSNFDYFQSDCSFVCNCFAITFIIAIAIAIIIITRAIIEVTVVILDSGQPT